MTEGPDYSQVAEYYSTSRPGYPEELFEWLASLVERRDVAWDAATGSGQAAVSLAKYFQRVIATDISEEQIRHARAHPRIEYRAATAEASGLPDDSVDLVVSAAALHWFDLERFYAEVRRVARPGGVLAAWTYHVAYVEAPFDEVFGPFYRDIVAPYFAPGARLVDDRYEAIALPGSAVDAPSYSATVNWTSAEIVRFVRTWSGVQTYMEVAGQDPVTELAPAIEELCGSPDAVHELRWPLYLKAARLEG
jgi:SAM-dependent methyltransferase